LPKTSTDIDLVPGDPHGVAIRVYASRPTKAIERRQKEKVKGKSAGRALFNKNGFRFPFTFSF
jgi:hypothetical protein